MCTPACKVNPYWAAQRAPARVTNGASGWRPIRVTGAPRSWPSAMRSKDRPGVARGEGGGLEGEGDVGVVILGGFGGHDADPCEACDEAAVNGGEQRGDLRVGGVGQAVEDRRFEKSRAGVHTVEREDMEVRVEIDRTSEALQKRDGAALGFGQPMVSCLTSKAKSNRSWHPARSGTG